MVSNLPDTPRLFVHHMVARVLEIWPSPLDGHRQRVSPFRG